MQKVTGTTQGREFNSFGRSDRRANSRHATSRNKRYKGDTRSQKNQYHSNNRQSLPDNRQIINQYRQGSKTKDSVLKVTVSNIKQSIKQKNPNHALILLNNVINVGITPDTITYSAAISACEKAGGIDGMNNTLKLLQEMKEEGITPDTISYSAAISACEKAGGTESMKNALTLLQEMKDLGMLNNELEDAAALNLHQNTFFSKQTWNELSEKDPSKKGHIPGIHPALARIYLNALLQDKKAFPSTIIVGQHGDNSLKDAVLSFLTDKKIPHAINPSNQGQIIINSV